MDYWVFRTPTVYTCAYMLRLKRGEVARGWVCRSPRYGGNTDEKGLFEKAGQFLYTITGRLGLANPL